MSEKSIAVLTLNPGYDRTVYLDGRLSVGGSSRAVRTVVSQGSKGANQAILLSNIGKRVEYFSFGEDDPFLRREGISLHLTPCRARARVNLKLVESDGRGSEINEPGGPVCREELAALTDRLLSSGADVVCLCGSFPQGVESDVYKLLINRLRERNCVTVLDSSGEALRRGVTARPDLIKPNREELASLGFGFPHDGSQAIEICGKVKEKFGCDVLCTLDADGSVFVGEGGAYRVTGSPEALRSICAAGDSYLAAYVASRYLDGREVGESLVRGAAAAVAKLALIGTEIPTAEQIDAAVGRVRVEKIK